MSATIAVNPSRRANGDSTRPLLVGLTLALILHAIFLLLPYSPGSERIRQPSKFQLTLTAPTPSIEKSPLQSEKTEDASQEVSRSEPSKSAHPEPIAPQNKQQEPKQNTSQPVAEPKASGAAVEQGNPEIPPEPPKAAPSTPGAKTRSTVFDPRMTKKLKFERNRVRQVQSRDTEYTTNGGMFVQRGDKCWEEKDLLPGDIDSNVSQRFKIKCTINRRSQQDIDRLAEKYGIP